MSAPYRLLCVSETLSPITHMSRSEGNESLVAREPVVTPRGVAFIPCLSGNAIRHRCVREPGMRWLIREYGLHGKLDLKQLNFLIHGGNLTEGGGRENTQRVADWQRIFPLGRLLGGCLPDQVLAGSLNVWRGALVCEENRQYLSAVCPDDVLPEKMRAAETFVSGYQYTRGDARKMCADLHPLILDERLDDDTNLMIFAGQSVTRGAAFVHGFEAPHASELEFGALLWSLHLWQTSGGTIGGQVARGHGRLGLSIVPQVGTDVDGAVNAYLEHARTAKDEAVKWLMDVFSRPEKPNKGGKKKAA